MKKVVIKLSNDEFDTVKSCFRQHSSFDYIFRQENLFCQDDEVELLIPLRQFDNFMMELAEARRAKGTINSIHTSFGRKVDSIIDRLTTEFYG
ncbi:hypothetical protein JYG30_19780 [Fibrella sp. USSR17]